MRIIQVNLQQKAKPKTQSVCMRVLILVVFWVCAHSNKHCTCGQTSVRHIKGAHNTPAVLKQHDDVTKKNGWHVTGLGGTTKMTKKACQRYGKRCWKQGRLKQKQATQQACVITTKNLMSHVGVCISIEAGTTTVTLWHCWVSKLGAKIWC